MKEIILFSFYLDDSRFVSWNFDTAGGALLMLFFECRQPGLEKDI
jgi:hypothetical protein